MPNLVPHRCSYLLNKTDAVVQKLTNKNYKSVFYQMSKITIYISKVCNS